jgi:hypothetical protein
MDRRRFGMMVAAGLAGWMAAPRGWAGDHDDHGGEGHGGEGHGRDGDRRGGDGRDGEWRHYRREDYERLARYYDGRRDLPPGMRRRLYRTGHLPPGWEGRMRPLPPEMMTALPPAPPYCRRGYLDGYAVVIDPRTRVVLDAVDMVGALTGH